MGLPKQLVWPAVGITAKVADPRQIAIGQSRFGGLPDVPADFVWPRWHDRPLAFLAQINLADIAAFECSLELPKSGWLVFFYDPEQEAWGFDPADKGCSLVAYFPEGAKLVTRALPDDMPDEGRFSVAALTFTQKETMPDTASCWIETLDLTPDEEMALSNELATYVAGTDLLIHQIGGHPLPVQNPMELECQLVTHGVDCGSADGYGSARAEELAQGAVNWRCLLQLDSDDEIDWMWGDVGRIYFWMTTDDIAKRRFENAWLIFQCC